MFQDNIIQISNISSRRIKVVHEKELFSSDLSNIIKSSLS